MEGVAVEDGGREQGRRGVEGYNRCRGNVFIGRGRDGGNVFIGRGGGMKINREVGKEGRRR
jgi:hypothetical protein